MTRLRLRSSFVGLIALFLLAGSLSACGAKQAAGTETLRVWYSTDDPVERVWSQQLARQFEQSHPGTNVSLTVLSFEDMNTKLQLALSAGDPPDLAYVTPRGPGIPAYVGAHRLRDLTPFARSYDWSGKMRANLLASYNQPFSYYGPGKGQIMAIPQAIAAVAVLYNRRLLRRLHLPVPKSSAAFEQALARAKARGYIPIGIGNADGWVGDDLYLTLVNSLVSPQSLAPEQSLSSSFSFLRPPYLAAAVTLRQWAQRNYLTPNFGGLDAQEGIDEFFHGDTLFQLVSSSENAQIMGDDKLSKLPIGVFAFPRPHFGGVVPYSGYLGWVIPKVSHHAGVAAAFINGVLSGTTSRFLLRRGVLPASRQLPRPSSGWQQEYLRVLNTARPGVYLDAAPIGNLNATMEANVQLLLQGYESPTFLPKSLQEVYQSHGAHGSTARIDGEF